MNRSTYCVYYDWKGSSASDPFVQQSTPAQVEHALREFPKELRLRLEDQGAKVKTSEVLPGSTEVELSIDSVASEEQINEALVRTLNSWRLYGKPAGSAN